MRKDFERSIEQARLETELVSRESCEELRNGLRVVHEHDHSRTVDKLSQQELVAKRRAQGPEKRVAERYGGASYLSKQMPTVGGGVCETTDDSDN